MSLNPNSAQGNSNSTRTFVTALVANSGLLLVEVAAFLLLKQRLWRIYSPRTHLPPPQKRAQELPNGLWRWLPALLRMPTKDIIHKNGLDAYMFLRYMKMLITILLVYTIVTFAVIIPVNSINIINLNNGVERISWMNIIEPQDQGRFAAHTTVAYILTFFVIYMINREMRHFVEMRHEFLTSKSHSRLAQARTVLITSVPEDLADEQSLRKFASFVPGGVDKVWLFRDTRELNELYEQRQDACELLEAAESQLLKLAMKAWRKRRAAQKKARKAGNDVEKHQNGATEEAIEPPSMTLLNELVPAKQRPRHRAGLLGILGKKVDTIDWCKTEIARLNKAINEMREQIVKGKFLGSAFIRCNLQAGAHVLAQCISHHQPLMMYDKWMEANPKDIVWQNLDDGALEIRSRFVLSWLATGGLIFAWTFPVAFIGTLSNLDDLCGKVKWLSWVCVAPNPIPGIIQGVLPPALLAALFATLPYILRALAWYQCIPRYSLISLSVYKRFFLFLLVHGFLIVTLSAGITRAVRGIIERPTETVQELASQLPGASVFFLTYMVTQGLAGAGNALAQFVPLLLHFIKKWFLGRTPRQAYEVTFMMPAADFGAVLPRLSLLATIAFAYSVLSPLINLLALISFAMFYVAWKFLFTQVFDQPDEMETGGLYFPMAVSNLFVGLYIEHICLACLFFLKSSVSKEAGIVQAGLMLALLGITAVAQIFITHCYGPITKYLPMSLAMKQMSERLGRRRILSFYGNSDQNGGDGGDFIDLFSAERIKNLRKRIKKTTKKIDETFDKTFDHIKSKVSMSVEDDERRLVREAKARKKPAASSDEEDDDGDSKTQHGTEEYELRRMDSNVSLKSKASKSSKSSKSKFQMRIPVIDAAAPRPDDDSDDEESDDEHAFDHPSTYRDQPWVWIPQDPLGLSKLLTSELNEAGVMASDMGAIMDVKGIVEVTRNPPDKEWTGGHDI
ncbi:hypothetical protein AX16_010631 [Volvariella volvacea WC 439]|nr:hypothetical protein AX16_010631 [Volvariella volvacea WC 439]